MPKMSGTRASTLAVAIIVAFGIAGSAFGADPSGPCTVRKEANVPAKMRDGTILYSDVYRPAEAGTYPVLLIRLPYNKAFAQSFVYGPPEFVRGPMLHRRESGCPRAIRVSRSILPVQKRNE